MRYPLDDWLVDAVLTRINLRTPKVDRFRFQGSGLGIHKRLVQNSKQVDEYKQ